MLQALCAVAKKPVRCLRGHGDPVRIKRLANRPIKVLSATLLDKRGYGNLSEGVGECRPERSAARRGVEGSHTAIARRLTADTVRDPSIPRLAGAPFRMADAAASTVRDLLIPHGALAQNDKAGAARLGLPRPA